MTRGVLSPLRDAHVKQSKEVTIAVHVCLFNSINYREN